ncbi:MAG TPA: DUF354 domain-containing protein [Ignavibacteriaceae bacterium]|nr:DUF354 domain-containing protein [Ignavibacteriaceae bacterium]
MRILIDIGHPAHVHYFKNFIRQMQLKGHNFIIIARDKEITFNLLISENLNFYSRKKGAKSLIGKILYLFYGVFKIYIIAKKHKPAIFMSFASSYAAIASKICGKPHISLDDTEHAKFELMIYPRFTDVMINPEVFTLDLGVKQIRINTLIELSYLHKKYFVPDKRVWNDLNVKENTPYIIIRFVSWDASHDRGQRGLSYEDKISLVNYLIEKEIKFFISAESELEETLEKYILKIAPNKLHDAIYFARLYIGEGGTTASESVILGTPAIYINSLLMGYIKEEINAGLLFHITDINKICMMIERIMFDKIFYSDYNKQTESFISQKISLTDFLVWFVDNYPQSFQIMKENPRFQNNFR